MNRKILFISHASAVGGATRSIMFLAKHVPNSLLLVPNRGPILDLYQENGVRFEIQRVPNLFYSTYQPVSLFGIVRLTKDLPKLFKLHKYIADGFTTLHFNEIVFAPSIFLLRRFYGKRIRIITHARVTMPVFRFGWSRAAFRQMLKASDVIIAIGKNELEPFADFPCAIRMTNPVEFGSYSPQFRKTDYLHQKYGIPDQTVIAGAFAQLHKGKGQDFILQSLKSSLPSNFHLLLFGEGPMEEELRTFIRMHHLERHVSLAGYTNNVFEAMEGCDFIIRAEDFGYLGRDVIEANALGVPILTALSTGYEDGELFESSYNGLSFLPRDTTSFLRSLRSMIESCHKYRGKTVRDQRGYILAEDYVQRITPLYFPETEVVPEIRASS